MTALEDVKQAALGWLDLIAGRPSGAERFDASPRGLVHAAAFYFLMVLLTIAVLGLASTLPSYPQLFVSVVVNALPLLAVALVIALTTRLLRPGVPVVAMLVPATYAMAFLLLVGLPLSLVFGDLFANAMLGALGYLLYREARDIAHLNMGISIAFAVLTVAVLVALPIGLYMVSTPAIPAS